MSKYVIKCPKCEKYVEASTGLFSRKKVVCACGENINTSATRFISKECPHCGNEVVYDQTKGNDAECPVCRNKINTLKDLSAKVRITCPACNGELYVNKDCMEIKCNMCKVQIDVQKRIMQQEIKDSNILSDIKWEAAKGMLVWKHPIEDFNLGSQVTVHESQEVIFFKDGKALDKLPSGRHSLTTQKIPLLSEIYKLPKDVDAALHSEIYFVNKTIQMGIKWGSVDTAQIIDPCYKLPIEIGAAGTFDIGIINSRNLILQLVGSGNRTQDNCFFNSNNGYSVDMMKEDFSGMITMLVTTLLAQIIIENKIDILKIDTKKIEIAAILEHHINMELEKYGIYIPKGQFRLLRIYVNDSDGSGSIQRLKNLHSKVAIDTLDYNFDTVIEKEKRELVVEKQTTEAVKQLMDSQLQAEETKIKASTDVLVGESNAQIIRTEGKAEADVMREKGYTEKDVMQADVQKAYAQGLGNISISGTGGNVAGEMIGLGVGMATAGVVSSQIGEMFRNISINNTVYGAKTSPKDNMIISWNCVNCGKKEIESKFCPDCGKDRGNIENTWNCRCGIKELTSNFCPDCGTRKEW